jgi:hypothetical protein
VRSRFFFKFWRYQCCGAASYWASSYWCGSGSDYDSSKWCSSGSDSLPLTYIVQYSKLYSFWRGSGSSKIMMRLGSATLENIASMISILQFSFVIYFFFCTAYWILIWLLIYRQVVFDLSMCFLLWLSKWNAFSPLLLFILYDAFFLYKATVSQCYLCLWFSQTTAFNLITKFKI